MKTTKVVLIAFSFALIAFKFYSLYSIKFEIDSLTEQLSPQVNKLPLNARVDFKDYYGSYESYVVTQYLLAPRVVLINGLPDTALVIQKANSSQKLPGKYRVISQSTAGDKSITLQTRAR